MINEAQIDPRLDKVRVESQDLCKPFRRLSEVTSLQGILTGAEERDLTLLDGLTGRGLMTNESEGENESYD